MITFTLRLVIPPKKREEIIKTLRLLMGPTQVQSDCLKFQCYQDIEDENVLLLLEEWKTQSALERHIRSKDYRMLLAIMDMANEPPGIEFNEVAHTSGMELIQAVRRP